jgi:hypothetical protein
MASEEKHMKATYRRREPVSRLERLLADLLPENPSHEPAISRLDFARSEDLEIKRSPSHP